MATLNELKIIAAEEVDSEKPLIKNVNGVEMELSDDDYEQLIKDRALYKLDIQNNDWERNRREWYPTYDEFVEAYTEKEILGMSDKWDAYVEKYNKVRTDYPKPDLTEEELNTEFSE